MDLETNFELKYKGLNDLADAIVNMEEEKAETATKNLLAEGVAPEDILEQGLVVGMSNAGLLFEREEYFITDILLCADAMESAFSVLEPYLVKQELSNKGIIIIGVIQGDTHDIGKNIVAIMLKGAGFQVIDLGKDVAPEEFVNAAVHSKADIIAISSLMTTTMWKMKEVIEILKNRGIREQFSVICGGRPLSNEFTRNIGADGYSADANSAVRLAFKIMENINKKI